MIVLGFSINSLGFREDWSSVSAMELHYDEFLGEVKFEVNGVDVAQQLVGIPVYDFADCLYGLILGLQRGASDVFEFTDSPATIRLHRSPSDRIEITSATGCVAESEYDDLCNAALKFLQEVLSFLLQKRGGLLHNEHFRRSLARAGTLI